MSGSSHRRLAVPLAALLVVVSVLAGGTAVSGAGVIAPVGADTTSPAQVRARWYEILKPAPEMGFTGDVDRCLPGTTTSTLKAAELRRINAYRQLAGVGDTVENPAWSVIAQRTALIMSASGDLSHSPGPNWNCYTTSGAAGAATSNLALGIAGPYAVDGYIEDPGANNTEVGHRRWLLCADTTQVGMGDVPGGPSSNWAIPANAIKVFDQGVSTTGQQRRAFVAWPNPGIVPVDYAKALGLLDRFSLQVPRSVSVAGAQVQVVSNTRGTISIGGIVRDDSLYCEPAVVWVPQVKPNAGETWTITVSGLQPSSGPAISHTYAVNFTSLSVAQPFVTATHRDFLGRAPTASESATLSRRLDNTIINGTFEQGRSGLVDDLSRSPEWIRHVLDGFYRDTLGRGPDAGGLAYWTGVLQSKRRSVASVAAAFYSSSEYYRRSGGTTSAWIGDLYRALLGRSPDTAGRAYWVAQVSRRGREAVAQTFYQSPESCRDRVRTLYQQLLGRSPDSAGLNYWAGRVASLGDLSLAAYLAASTEYLNRSFVRFP